MVMDYLKSSFIGKVTRRAKHKKQVKPHPYKRSLSKSTYEDAKQDEPSAVSLSYTSGSIPCLPGIALGCPTIDISGHKTIDTTISNRFVICDKDTTRFWRISFSESNLTGGLQTEAEKQAYSTLSRPDSFTGTGSTGLIGSTDRLPSDSLGGRCMLDADHDDTGSIKGERSSSTSELHLSSLSEVLDPSMDPKDCHQGHSLLKRLKKRGKSKLLKRKPSQKYTKLQTLGESVDELKIKDEVDDAADDPGLEDHRTLQLDNQSSPRQVSTKQAGPTTSNMACRKNATTKQETPIKVFISSDRLHHVTASDMVSGRSEPDSMINAHLLSPYTPKDRTSNSVTHDSNSNHIVDNQRHLKRMISSSLKKEIERSLIDWPGSFRRFDQSKQSTRSLQSGLRLQTKPEAKKAGSLRDSRPLSWSCDESPVLTNSNNPSTTDIQLKSLTHRDRQGSLSCDGENTSCLFPTSDTLPDEISQVETTINELEGSDHLYEDDEEFDDALTVLRKFSSLPYTQENRRMSQPFPIKARPPIFNVKVKSETHREQVHLQSSRMMRCKSKSEPTLSVKTTSININKKLAKVCPAVGDIVVTHSKDLIVSSRSTVLADPLWHHVTHEREELSFHVGDVITVTDMSDKDWWWGQLASEQTEGWQHSTESLKSGWFPSAFVRLQQNLELSILERLRIDVGAYQTIEKKGLLEKSL